MDKNARERERESENEQGIRQQQQRANGKKKIQEFSERMWFHFGVLFLFKVGRMIYWRLPK